MNYIQYPWIYKPHYREERMHLQESVFMLWGADQRPVTANILGIEYMSTGIVNNAENGFGMLCINSGSTKKGIAKCIGFMWCQ